MMIDVCLCVDLFECFRVLSVWVYVMHAWLDGMEGFGPMHAWVAGWMDACMHV